MSRLWNDHVRRLSPYVPGEQPTSARLLKLNTNENPHPPSPRALAVLGEAVGSELRLYPDPGARELRTAAASRAGLASEQTFAGNGSDEVLALSFAAFFGARGGEVSPLLFPDVSYSFYPVWADFFGIATAPVALREDFTLDPGPYAGARGGIVFPNPNAPTGIAMPLRDVEALLEAAPDSVVVVDEAYVEFGAESAAPLVDRYENLLVVQTLSKSHSLAGLRVGFAFGAPELIEALDRVKSSFNSYPVDRIASRIACAALADDAYFDSCRDQIVATRDWTTRRLLELGFEVLPSSANFVFARHPGRAAAKLQTALRERGVLVRHFDQPRTRNHLRITIGTDEQMKQLVSVLAALLAGE